MPQITRARRKPLVERKEPIKDVGDICYLITAQIIIPMWMAEPRWTTISKIRRMLVKDVDLNKLKSLLRGCPFDDTEILNQAALAYEEFYRRCGANYENDKARQNTDVYAGVPFAKTSNIYKGE